MIVDKLQWFCALRVVLQSVLVHPRKRLRCSLYYAAAGKVFNSPVASRYIHRRLIILLLLTASVPSVNCIGAKVLCRWQPLSRAQKHNCFRLLVQFYSLAKIARLGHS